jgi:hypothetical protein
MADVVPSLPILVTLMMKAIRSSECWFLQEPRGITFQKTAFFTGKCFIVITQTWLLEIVTFLTTEGVSYEKYARVYEACLTVTKNACTWMVIRYRNEGTKPF